LIIGDLGIGRINLLRSYVLLLTRCMGQADRQEEEVALRREDAVIFTAWDTWKARSKVCPNTGREGGADDQKLQAVSMDHKRIKRFAWSRWIRASELALQAKQAKATADRHLIGTSASFVMRKSAD
jgi:hypothetical protein